MSYLCLLHKAIKMASEEFSALVTLKPCDQNQDQKQDQKRDQNQKV